MPFISSIRGSYGPQALGSPLLKLEQIGSNTYEYKDTVNSILDIQNDSTSSILPTDRAFFLKYRITVNSVVQTITVSCRKNSSSGKISQSAFTMFDNNLSISNVTDIAPLNLDDHDSLAMDCFGNGLLAANNTNFINDGGSWYRLKGSSVIDSPSPISTVFPYSVTSILSSNQSGTMVAFPKTESNVYINFATSAMKINNFNNISTPAQFSSVGLSGTSGPNTILVISDGVNGFRIYRYGQSQALDIFVNLNTGQIISTETVSFSHTLDSATSTEEDAFLGDLLFAIDGSNSFYSGSQAFSYTRKTRNNGIGWRDSTSLTATDGVTLNYGQPATQSGQDLFGSIGTDRYVWFYDWGHDNGGLFNRGNDDRLGIGKTNIYHIDNNYTE